MEAKKPKMEKNRQENEKTAKQSYLDQISVLSGEVGSFATALMVTIVAINIITRALFNYPIPGFYEITGLMGVFFYSFGLVYAAFLGSHVTVTILSSRVKKPQVRRILETFRRLLLFIYCSLLVYAGATMAWQQGLAGEVTDELKIPVAPFRMVIVVAFIVLGLVMLIGKQKPRGEEH